MYCLYCGDCCRRMSPISQPEPCPHLIETGTFVFCGVYQHRPKECVSHEYPARFCPIGMSVLGLSMSDTDKIRARIDEGWDLIKRAECVGGVSCQES